MIRSVLMVCEGNVCRSPLAAALLAREVPGLEVASAGTRALVGAGADLHAVELMSERSIDISGHVARTVDPQMMRSYDLVLVMTSAQREELLTRYPFALLHTPFSRGRPLVGVGRSPCTEAHSDRHVPPRQSFIAAFRLAYSKSRCRAGSARASDCECIGVDRARLGARRPSCRSDKQCLSG